MSGDRQLLHEQLATLVARYHDVRSAVDGEPGLAARVGTLQAFQAARLEATYADLRSQDRYGAAVQFFLSDLYGPTDLTARDEQVLRALGKLQRFMPQRALEAFARAMELHVLTLELDADTARRLPGAGAVDVNRYTAAYAAAGRVAVRARQIDLVLDVGRVLDAIVRHPEIGLAIRVARGPAHAAGYGALQDFVERGWRAFEHLGGADEFLETIARRERRLMGAALAGDAAAFAAATAGR